MASGQDDSSLLNFLKKVADKMDEEEDKRQENDINTECSKAANQSNSAVIEFDINDFEIEVASTSGSKTVVANKTESEILDEGAQKSEQAESLESLMMTLKQNMRSTDWLKENTAEKWIAENPELASEYIKRAKEDPAEEISFP